MNIMAANKSLEIIFEEGVESDDDDDDDDDSTGAFLPNGDPKKLVVFGAGHEAVNGKYHRRYDELHKFWCYIKEGQWEGKAVMFCINRCVNKVKKTSWWQIKVQAGGVIYRSCLQEKLSIVPARGWFCDNGTMCSRPPILYYDNKPRDWRDDPQESFADFTIEIAETVADKCRVAITTTYNVHKLIIANGSTYFAGVCANGLHFAEGSKSTVRIKLDSSTAARFPNFLDYMYIQFASLGVADFGIHPDYGKAIVELYWLADYFQVPHLCKQLQKAWKKNLNLARIPAYLACALEIGVQPLVDPVLTYICDCLLNFRGDQLLALAKRLDKPCLISLLQKTNWDQFHSRKASELVSAFCNEHSVDADEFQALTHSSLLPYIASIAAWSLLKKHSELLQVSEDVLDDFQLRCIEAIAKDFASLDSSESGPLHLQSLSSKFLKALIIKVTERATVAVAMAELNDNRNVRRRRN
jgi:hypothetical protein